MVSVLVGHVVERIVDTYATFREIVLDIFDGTEGDQVREVVLSLSELKEWLKVVCEADAVQT